MKRIFLILISLKFGVLGFAQNDITWCNLKGKVKLVNEKYYDVEFKNDSWIVGNIRAGNHNKMFFSEEGIITNKEYFDQNGEVKCKSNRIYKNGKLHKEYYRFSDDKLIREFIYKYITENELYFEGFDNESVKVVYGSSFIENNRVVRQKYISVESHLDIGKQLIFFSYDDKGQLIEEKKINSMDNLKYHYAYVYLEFDKNGNWVKRVTLNCMNDKKPIEIAIRTYVYY